MHYAVRINVETSPKQTDLDPEQAHVGAQQILAQMGTIARIEGPGGLRVVVHTAEARAHPRGALVKAVVEAPTASAAETGVRVALSRLLTESARTAYWWVAQCAAVPHAGPPVPGLRIGACAGSPEATARARRHVLGHAARLRAFGPAMFEVRPDPAEPGRAALLAGSILMGMHIVLDGLFNDLDTMHREQISAAELTDPWILGELPAAVATRCDDVFVRRFLLVGGTAAHRLVEPVWQPPTSFAEALALYTMFQAAHDYLVGNRLLVDPGRHFDALRRNAFERSHQEWLGLLGDAADPFGDSADPWRLSTWFDPLDTVCVAHPYVYDSTPV
ncbi:hypothetical protein [Nocardiopsis ansamitocini]|uniref:Uncharacterized protein n=1 Tax=Nocardiopsis ansamitocini TaxID=1670832 RepID=A0A9W6P631_9ACTN|nr:hypothetical protein [Nocardiopsis ansamitocini]GLU47678.1 hypothetical protein Nans01_20290 [Nocardiopsis ansamitocini]